MILGIDASNIRAGGGLVHLRELLTAAEPEQYGVGKVVVWGGAQTLSVLPQRPWLQPVWQPACEQNLVRRFGWQTYDLPRLAHGKADLLFVPGGTHIGGFRPYVSMIQNRLPFEANEIGRYGFSEQAIRLRLLRHLQLRTLKKAAGVIFLTEYFRNKVQPKIRPATPTIVIPHGVSEAFRAAPRVQLPITEYSQTRPFRFLYVSWVEPYKEQLNLVRAIAKVHSEGCPVALDLAGAGESRTVAELRSLVSEIDPTGAFLRYHGPVRYPEIAGLYRQADAFVFPSSCETFGMPLLEAMAAGLPVASSNKTVMPEVLGDAGIYFRPNVDEISACVRALAEDVNARQRYANAAYRRAARFTWARTAEETFAFVAGVGRDLGLASYAKRSRTGDIVHSG